MPDHATPPVPLTTASRTAGAAPRTTGPDRTAGAAPGTSGAAPCAWPVASVGSPAVTGGRPARRMGALAGTAGARSRAFTECPGAQIAAMARAQAITAMASADTLLAPVPLRVAGQPEPGAALPPGDHPGPERHCMGTFRGQRDQAGQARAFLAAFLGGWARADDAMLLIGELSANAVVHTGSGAPGGLFTVRATLAGDLLRAEVEDQGSSWNGRIEEAECPHGLFLLRQLATRCGTRRARGGWVTWFVLGDEPITQARAPQSGRSGINPVHSPASGHP